MSGEENPPISGATSPQCQFFVQRKKRLCRMTVKPGRQYCGEHQPQPTTEAGQVDKRIPCPNDPKHTCYASKLLKHLAICNARRTDQPPYIIHNINAPEEVEPCPRRPLSSIPKDELTNIIDKINHLYAKHVEGKISEEPTPAIHRAVLAEFSEEGRAESSRRHLRQVSALLALAERARLPGERTCYVELGAGKGQLSYYACHAWCGSDGSRVLAVDRAPLRHKRDNKLRSAPPTATHGDPAQTGASSYADGAGSTSTHGDPAQTRLSNAADVAGATSTHGDPAQTSVSNAADGAGVISTHGDPAQTKVSNVADGAGSSDRHTIDDETNLTSITIDGHSNSDGISNESKKTKVDISDAQSNTTNYTNNHTMSDSDRISNETDQKSIEAPINARSYSDGSKPTTSECGSDATTPSNLKGLGSEEVIGVEEVMGGEEGMGGEKVTGGEEGMGSEEVMEGEEVAVRLRADLAHLALEAVPVVAGARAVVGLAKHLCGVATDYALRCVAARGVLHKTRGIVLATCCHHRVEMAPYVGREHLQELGISAEELNIILGVVSWATCGDGRSRERRAREGDNTSGPQHTLSQSEREEVGRRAKALVDWGRVLWLRARGFDARLAHYVPRHVSPENRALLATR